MAKKHLGWLIALLAATPGLYVACGGDESPPASTGTAGTGGTGGATGSGGSGGATTGGTAGTADAGGSAGKAGGTPEAGVMCGTMTCSTNPTSTNICDTANNRCVDCLTDADCAVETLNKICDTRLNAMSLPAYNCVQCIETSQCPMGSTCSTTGNTANTCVTACGTANCSTNPTGNNICDLPNNRCVGCLADSDCADETTDKTCDLRPAGMSMLPAGNCVQCTTDAQCPSGQVCGTTGNTANTCLTSCGTTSCTLNPTGNNICDLPNNRCVGCMGDTDCADETTDKFCDTSVNPTNMLPTFSCEECLTTAHCPAGNVCLDNNCEPSCTTDAQCSTDGGGNNPHCNPTTKVCAECGADAHCGGTTPYCTPDGSCEQCTTDAHCTTQPRILCNPTNNTCVQCIDSTQCTPPATCGRQGTCTGGGPADSGGGGG